MDTIFILNQLEIDINFTKHDLLNFYATLTNEQRSLWDLLDASVKTRGAYYFLDGPGGSGKTYFENGFIKYCMKLY